MRIHEKARLYDSLMEDLEKLYKRLKDHHTNVENLKETPSYVEESERNKDVARAMLCGMYAGSNFGLELRLKEMENVIKYHKNQS